MYGVQDNLPMIRLSTKLISVITIDYLIEEKDRAGRVIYVTQQNMFFTGANSVAIIYVLFKHDELPTSFECP